MFGGLILGTRCIKSLIESKEIEGVVRLGLVLTLIAAICLVLASMLAPQQILSLILPMSLLTFGFGIAASSLNRITLSAAKEKQGPAASLFYFLMVSIGTLASLLLSIIENTPLSVGILIALIVGAAFLSYRAREA